MPAGPRGVSAWRFKPQNNEVTDAVQRLRTRPQFQAALAGRTLARTPHFALHCCSLEPGALFPEPTPTVWLGAMVPKRWAKRAVTRNTIKRQIYHVGAVFESALAARAHVVRLRAGFDRARFVSATSDTLKHAVRVELQQLFAQARVAAAS